MSPHRSKRMTTALTQTAVYWGTPASDGSGGRTFATAIEIYVRWEQRHELFVDANREEQQSQAIVYVDQDVVLGGYLYLGDLDDLASGEEADPMTLTGAYEIRQFMKSSNRRGTVWFRKAVL